MKNASGSTVGPAFNVTLNSSEIQVGTQSTATTSIPTGGSIFLGTIGPGTSRSVALRYPGSAGTPGALAQFMVNYGYLGAPAPGTVTYSSRTRLP
ncbi:MAG: hypothetical protein QM758_25880 [Armatimonas sp.]